MKLTCANKLQYRSKVKVTGKAKEKVSDQVKSISWGLDWNQCLMMEPTYLACIKIGLSGIDISVFYKKKYVWIGWCLRTE